MHTEGHDMGRDVADSSTPGNQFDAEHPGYETTDVNVSGVVVFLAGLSGFVLIFFVVCFGIGKFINSNLDKQYTEEYGAPTKWKVEAGQAPTSKEREDLASNPEIQQKQLKSMIDPFPEPKLEMDDGLQATADLHAKEDLLLNHYSSVDGQPGTFRIPIDHAMELIAQRGLPVAGSAKSEVAGADKHSIQAPLTTGFARTGYEYTVIEAREQKTNYRKALAQTEPAPTK
jgi:hypothetical protein